MTTDLRQQALDRIRRNIAAHGHHIYTVGAGAFPRFSYTIGLSETLGAELVLGGGIYYMADDVGLLMNALPGQLRNGRSFDDTLEVAGLGSFTLRRADSSWVTPLLLGASDYYGRDIDAFQIVPDATHWTIDVPDMRMPWSAATASVWRHLHEPWSLAVPESSEVATGLDVLQGAPVVKATRWEEAYWEMFSEAGCPSGENMRVVSPTILIGSDDSLRATLEVSVEEGLWREGPGAPWQLLRHD